MTDDIMQNSKKVVGGGSVSYVQCGDDGGDASLSHLARSGA